MFINVRMSQSLDNWITGNYGEDQIEDEPEDDPRDDEPDDFDERRCEED